MELMYPWIIVLCLIFALVIWFVKFNKKEEYTQGKKVANTNFIKDTPYYKQRMRKYKLLSTAICVLSGLSIIITSVLIARPVTKDTIEDEKYNRDIIIGLDVSLSEAEVDLELVKKFRTIIPDIKGDRIGVVVFNTAPVVFCPLTEDYDYVDKSLEKIQTYMQKVIDNNNRVPIPLYGEATDEDYDCYNFFYGGAIANNEERGSSLIGDGLAGTLYSFPDLKTNKERTRIILFATDNALSGEEAISLDDACKLCKQNNINLYAYCPTTDMNIYATKDLIEAYKKSVLQTANGKFYLGDLDNMSSQMVREIKETKTTLLNENKKTYIMDHPSAFFIVVAVTIIVMIIVEKRIRI